MNLTKTKIFINKGKQTKVKNENQNIIIENTGDCEETIIIPRVFHASKENIFVNLKAETENGEECIVKFVNRKNQVVAELELNSEYYMKKPASFFMIAIRVKPHSKIKITNFEIKYKEDYEEEIIKQFTNNILVIAPGYPSRANKYNFSFVHTRVREYLKNGWNVDIAIANDENDNSRIYEFEGINVCKTSYLILRNLLQKKKYEKILVHFFVERYAQILDATDLSNTKVYLYSHGGDTIYRDINLMTTRYFEKTLPITSEQEQIYKNLDKILVRYNNMENVKFIYGSEWAKERSETLNNIKYKNVEIIPTYINEKIFKFVKKDEKLRKKVVIIRKFDNFNTYSIDTDVRAILELSKRECFKDLEFNIYGDGTEHDRLLKPIEKFSNVHIHKRFLTHEEIANVHKENGIALFATRYETQGVSAAEAAMSGLVVISSDVAAVPQVIDRELGTLCQPEDFKQYADKIEELYNNPKLFTRLNEKMHECVVQKCGYNATITKELNMFKEDEKKTIKGYKYKEQDNEILLTVAIPSYNVQNFIRNSVFSLINNELSHKLEVLIVNDGSKDETAKLGKELEELTKVNGKSIVKLVDKENGGHGSTINKGIELARGKYFKLMDGDDYFDTEELLKLIKILENEESDIILNNYVEDKAPECVKNVVKHYEFMLPGVQYQLEDLCYEGYGFNKWGPLLSTSTYKTQMLKDGNFKISENCFYVDMELNTFAFINAKTIVYYPLDIYVYYIGRAGQSISRDSYTRNYKHHETVTLRILKEVYSNNKISEIKKEYLINKIIIPLVEAQYYITTEYLDDNKPFKFFDSEIAKYNDIYNAPLAVKKRTKFHRKTNGRFIKLIHVYDKINGFIKKIRF